MSCKRMIDLIEALFPICRSITGNGVRQTLAMIQDVVPLEIVEVASGTQVLDWVVPPEWNIRDAFIKNSAGERVMWCLPIVAVANPAARASSGRVEMSRGSHTPFVRRPLKCPQRPVSTV